MFYKTDQLGVEFYLNISEAEHCSLFDLAQDWEEGRLHSMTVEGVFAGLIMKKKIKAIC